MPSIPEIFAEPELDIMLKLCRVAIELYEQGEKMVEYELNDESNL